MNRTIAAIQKDLALNSAHSDDIIWDFLGANQSDILKQKIKHLVPDKETGMSTVNNIRITLFENTWNQRKFTNGNLQSSIIYVMVTDEQPEYIEIPSRAQNAVKFSCHPIMRTRKCIIGNSSKGCCMIFIDEVGRVYQNWKQFVENNVLPPGFMVAPTYGVYSLDGNNEVALLCCKTPSSSIKQQVIEAVDTVAGIGGIAAAFVPLAALALPIAAPIAAASVAVGLCTAAYSTVRSGLELKDRSNHSQSISLADRSARNSWLGVFGGVAAVGAAGTTKVLAKAAATGKNINTVTQCVVNGISISSIILSGSSVANGVMDVILKWNDNEPISKLDLVQFAASLVIFTHSLHNFSFASTISDQARDGTIKKYRSELNKRQRKVFDKMYRETIRINGENRGKADIIRSFNNVPDSQNVTGSSVAPQSTNARSFSSIFSLNQCFNNFEGLALLLATNCGTKFMHIVFNSDSLASAIRQIREYYSTNVVNFILKLANTFIEISLDRLARLLKIVISAESIVWQIFTHCKSKYTQRTLQYLESQTIEILYELEEYFMKWHTVETQPLIKCSYCVGHYSITNV